MDESVQTQNLIRNVISEVVRESKNHKIIVEEDFVAYYVSLLQYDPNRQLTLERLLVRENVWELVRFLLQRLENTNDPQIETVKIQHEFKKHIARLEDAVVQFRKEQQEKLSPLLLSITEKGRISVDELYEKMTCYTILASGMGHPSDKNTYKEAYQVVTSVLYPEEMRVFPNLQTYIKQEMVECIMNITTGIRLYNQACKKGGYGINNIPQLVEDGLKYVQAKIQDCIEMSQIRIYEMSRFLEQYMSIKPITEEDFMVTCEFNSLKVNKKWEIIKDLKATYLQLVNTSKIILQHVAQLEQNRKALHDSFEGVVDTLRRIIIPNLYQSITEVFPLFTDLARIWTNFQEVAIRLNKLADIFCYQSHKTYRMEFDTHLEYSPFKRLKWVDGDEEQPIQEVSRTDITIHPGTDDWDSNIFQYCGFCCWILTQTDGVLLSGNRTLGAVEYKNKFYRFTSTIAMNSFIRNPDYFIMKTLELVRERVDLIELLNLMDDLKEYKDVKVLVQHKHKQIPIQHAEAQTDTHFEESFIDYNHVWNIWESKRLVICYYHNL